MREVVAKGVRVVVRNEACVTLRLKLHRERHGKVVACAGLGAVDTRVIVLKIAHILPGTVPTDLEKAQGQLGQYI